MGKPSCETGGGQKQAWGFCFWASCLEVRIDLGRIGRPGADLGPPSACGMSNVGGLMGLFFEDGRDTEGGAVLVTVLGRPRGHRVYFLKA